MKESNLDDLKEWLESRKSGIIREMESAVALMTELEKLGWVSSCSIDRDIFYQAEKNGVTIDLFITPEGFSIGDISYEDGLYQIIEPTDNIKPRCDGFYRYWMAEIFDEFGYDDVEIKDLSKFIVKFKEYFLGTI